MKHPDSIGDDGAPALGPLGSALRAGLAAYRRERMLPRLVPLGPEAIADTSAAGRRVVVVLLARALRGERQRGRAGHWSYSLDRHIGLVQAMAAERRGLIEALRATGEAATGRTIAIRHPSRPGGRTSGRTPGGPEEGAGERETATADRNPRWP